MFLAASLIVMTTAMASATNDSIENEIGNLVDNNCGFRIDLRVQYYNPTLKGSGIGRIPQPFLLYI